MPLPAPCREIIKAIILLESLFSLSFSFLFKKGVLIPLKAFHIPGTRSQITDSCLLNYSLRHSLSGGLATEASNLSKSQKTATSFDFAWIKFVPCQHISCMSKD